MKWRDHETALDARKELIRHGYYDAHSLPGQPQLWGRLGRPERYAIEAGHRRFHIVDYKDYAWLRSA
jgi:hypothetical protein